MSLKERKQAVGVKIETVEGVAETITAADIILVDNIQFSADTPALETNHQSSTLSKSAGSPGRTFGTISFDVLTYGANSAGVAPFWGKLLQACGFSEAIVGATSAEYKPASSGIKTLTIKRFYDGKSYELIGARGNVSRSGNAGEFAVYSFSFQGIYDPINNADATKDEALLEGTTFPTFLPKKYQNARLTVGGSYLAVVEGLSWDMSNTLSNVPDANTTNYKRVDLTDRNPSGELNVEAVLQAVHDFEDEVTKKTAVQIKNHIGADESGNGAGSLNTMTDSTKNWPASKWASGFSLLDSAGTVFAITASNATTLTVAGTPVAGNYVIYEPGKLIIETMPKCEFQSQNEGATDSRATNGLPFLMKKNVAAGNDEISIKVI